MVFLKILIILLGLVLVKVLLLDVVEELLHDYFACAYALKVLLQRIVVYFTLLRVGLLIRVEEVAVGLVNVHERVAHLELVLDVHHGKTHQVELLNQLADRLRKLPVLFLKGLVRLSLTEEKKLQP